MARIANLPVAIRNSTGLGGGRVVGWLPIVRVLSHRLSPHCYSYCVEQVKDDQKHKKKKSWVNFKNAVWHESFHKLLESIIQHAKTGYWFECGDNIQRRLWPLILILSADYEEQ